MKRGKLVLLSLVTILALTGCGKKELNCTMSQTTSGVTADYVLSISFDGDTVKDMNMEADVVMPESLQDQKSTFKTLFEEQSFEVEETSNGLHLKAGTGSEAFKTWNIGESKVDYDEAKEALEAAGFTCK